MARQTNADDIGEACKKILMDDHDDFGGVDCFNDDDNEGGVEYDDHDHDHENDHGDDDANGGWMEDHDSDWMQHHLLNSNCLIISGGGNKRQEHRFLIRFFV